MSGLTDEELAAALADIARRRKLPPDPSGLQVAPLPPLYPPGTSQGWRALAEAERALVEGRPLPEWAHREIVRAWRTFVQGIPPSGWTDAQGAAPRALGEAFGIEPRSGQLRAARARALALPKLLWLFGPGGLKRTPQGRQQAAALLGITPKQVKDWLPKTRANLRGHKPYRAAVAGAGAAHNPFGLHPSKSPKK